MNTERIFDAIAKASSFVILNDKRVQKRRQIEKATQRRCGNCIHWMKTSCVPEKVHKNFKSCNSPACEGFELQDVLGLIPRLRKELQDLDQQIAVVAPQYVGGGGLQ